MSLLFSPVEARSDGWSDWLAGGDAPGSARKATGLVPYFASIRHIVDYLSSLPIDGYKAEGKARRPTELPTFLRRQDEPGGPGLKSWVAQWSWGQAVEGNSVGWIVAADGFGYPTDILWLEPEDWTFDETMRQWYVFGQRAPAYQLVHSPWIVPSGKVLGISPLEHFAAFWKAGLSAQEYSDVGRGGGLPPAVLRNSERILNTGEAEIVQSRASRSFASGKPFVTGKDWDLTAQVIPPNQKNFLETLQLTANETAAIFGIDPREVGGSATESLTYATDESKALNRANNMRPYMERFEAMVDRILPPREHVRLNVDATVRTDLKTKTEIVGAKLKDGRMSVDEARAEDDKPPVPGGNFYNIPRPGTEPVNPRTGDAP